MPVVINRDTGLAENLEAQQAQAALQSGSHEFPLNDPEGNPASGAYHDVPDLLSQGYTVPSTEQLQDALRVSAHSTPGQEAKALAEAGASTSSFGLSTAAERLAGVDPAEIRARKEALELQHPVLQTGAELAGLVGTSITGVGEGAALAKLGQSIPTLGTSFAGKVATQAARAGLENMAFQAGDETSKMFAQDPHQSAETAAANVGLSGILGATVGAGIGVVPASWDALMEGKAGKFVSDLRARASDRLNNPDPVGTLTSELSGLHSSVMDMNSEVYGKTGLKSQEIAKLMPEMSPAIQEEPIKIQSKLQDSIDKMREQPFKYGGERYPGLLEESLNEFKTATQDTQHPQQLFNAMNDLKQQVNRYIPRNVTPDNPAFDAVQEFKNISKDLRTSLEDKNVWGAAGERQAAINKAFSEYLPSLKDFQKKFTADIAGQRMVDPGKVNTYVNQLGKPNAEIKQDVLRNFLNATDKYRTAIDDTHANLGIENPYAPAPMAAARASLNEVTPGAKVADMIIDKGIGHMVGGAIGGGIGAMAGHPGWGALLGQHMIGPVADKIVPQLIKPILDGPVSGGGMRAALQYGTAVVKGESNLARATKSVFAGSRMILSEPSAKEREKLDKRVTALNEDQSNLMDVGGKLGHYLPNHSSSLAEAATRAVQYLAQLKPKTAPVGPLDPPIVPNPVQEAEYNQALNIAENPLLILEYVKEGSLSQNDIAHLNGMYPNLMQRIQAKLMDNLVEHKANDGMLPYKTKIALSMLMAQPLESSMQPQAIMANQPMPNPAPMPTPKRPSATSMSKLAKLPSTYATPQQAREAKKTT